MTPKEARRMDRFAQLAVAAADQAADEAGLLGEVDPARVGVIVGTGVGGLDDAAGASARRGWRRATARSPPSSSR